MEENSLKPAKIRRRWRNLFIQPAGQVRLMFALPLIGLLAVEVLIMVLHSVLTGRLAGLAAAVPQATGPIAESSDAVRGILLVVMLIVFVCAIAFLISGLLISHRYYGPLVPMLRALNGMKEGKFDQRIYLRKGDELRELAEAINSLSESLAGKYSNAAPNPLAEHTQ